MKRILWLLIRHTSAASDRALTAFVRAIDARDAQASERDW